MDPRPPFEDSTVPKDSQPVRNLVFGDDRSLQADRAWLWINNQRWPNWNIDVVTASAPSSPWTNTGRAIELETWEPDSPRLTTEVTGVARVRHLKTDADARVVLGACTDADLLVVGPRGSSGIQAAYLGSVMDYVIRHARVPVLVTAVPDAATRILVCTDGSPEAENAIETVAALPLAQDAEQMAVVGVATVGIYDPRPEIDKAVDRAAQMLSAFEPEAVKIHTDGDAVGAVYSQIVELRSQLLVLGTRGLTGLRRLALGSFANSLVRVAPCSILVVPPREND